MNDNKKETPRQLRRSETKTAAFDAAVLGCYLIDLLRKD